MPVFPFTTKRTYMQKKNMKPFVKDFEHIKFIKNRLEYSEFELDMEKMFVQEKILKEISKSAYRLRLMSLSLYGFIATGFLAFFVFALVDHGLVACPICYLMGHS